MWALLSRIILHNRILLLLLIGAGTAFMAYKGSQIQLSYSIARVLPANDPVEQQYQHFRQQFGEDGSVMVIGLQDKELFTLPKFSGWYKLTQEIRQIEGIKEVVSVANLYRPVRNDSLHKFQMQQVPALLPQSQAETDSIRLQVERLPFYHGLVYNPETGATLMAITFDKNSLNSSSRISTVEAIKAKAQQFEQTYKTDLHYSGMPYIRTEMMKKVSAEMKLFSLLAVVVTGLILFAFFRSFKAVILSLGVVLIGVVFALGTLVLLHYKITLLSGLIPPLIIVIGVPNCIFLINKYQSDLRKHGSQEVALKRMIKKIGLSTFLANITTAIGFGVFYFTNSSLLVEFGVVAAISVMVTYVLCLVLIPIALSYMPLPSGRQTKHLESKRIKRALQWVDYAVHHYRPPIYVVIGLLMAVSIVGMLRIQVVGYVVDDLPKKDPIYTDLRFFETHFKGVLPFEVAVDTRRPGGIFADGAQPLYKIRKLQRMLAEYPEFSKPLSVVEGLSFLYQGYRGGNPKYYMLPNSLELAKLSNFAQDSQAADKNLSAFLDSTRQTARVSFQMADVGSARMKELLTELQPRVDSIFSPKDYAVTMTGHSRVFLKSNEYLLANLVESLVIAVALIALVGMFLFRSVPIIILSKLPSIIPLLITAGMMGFLDIHFKPSTILIFSIAFGIASDGTVYFLTKYRQELRKGRASISKAISNTIRETGVSMIYTAAILFSGFAIFAFSGFGGTAALGILLSITLLVAMCTNLILLPALLLSLEARKEARRQRYSKK